MIQKNENLVANNLSEEELKKHQVTNAFSDDDDDDDDKEFPGKKPEGSSKSSKTPVLENFNGSDLVA